MLEDAPEEAALIGKQLRPIQTLTHRLGRHPKMEGVADAVAEKVAEGEKVLVFCHHHATAQELAEVLHERVGPLPEAGQPGVDVWRAAWSAVLPTDVGESSPRNFTAVRSIYIEWLSSEGLRRQVGAWTGNRSVKTAQSLAKALSASPARHPKHSIAEAATALFRRLTHPESRSTLAILRNAAKSKDLSIIPGGGGTGRVLALCGLPHNGASSELFQHNRQPDTSIEIFNSPFGPDVLVATDALSEGVDLHKYCRHLVHYELDASPIRTVQRNGRVRRVDSWAATTGKPILYAYPAFGGTRDHRLVHIMKKRIDTFSLLLGGVPDFDIDDVTEADERWRQTVITHAKNKLRGCNVRLNAVDPYGPTGG